MDLVRIVNGKLKIVREKRFSIISMPQEVIDDIRRRIHEDGDLIYQMHRGYMNSATRIMCLPVGGENYAGGRKQ